MKLILAVIRDIDSESVIDALVKAGYRATRIASTGGFLRRGNMTLMTGVEDDQVQNVIELMKKSVSEPDDEQHRVTLFVVDATDFEQY